MGAEGRNLLLYLRGCSYGPKRLEKLPPSSRDSISPTGSITNLVSAWTPVPQAWSSRRIYCGGVGVPIGYLPGELPMQHLHTHIHAHTYTQIHAHTYMQSLAGLGPPLAPSPRSLLDPDARSGREGLTVQERASCLPSAQCPPLGKEL